ncbi:MAG: nucleotidyl transferase AbiEii/AbiGii toxin family protein [Nitrosotalea sp.]
MNLEFISELASKLKIDRIELVEKDVLLHQILIDLSKDLFFSKNFVFKGGTCLIKYHLGYFRFSEDIDFTWKDQSRFRGSVKAVRRELSPLIDQVGKILESIAEKRGLDFKCVKSDNRYVELGGGNKTCTFKIWYNPLEKRNTSYIKVQINFVEIIHNQHEEAKLHSMPHKRDEEMAALYDEYNEYSEDIPFSVYSVKEILSEKIRAILTRKGRKARDFLDIYFIQKQFNIKPSDVEKQSLEKINHTLEHYDKYQKNLENKKKQIEDNDIFEWGMEKDLLLKNVDETDFKKFLDEFMQYLKELIKKLDING